MEDFRDASLLFDGKNLLILIFLIYLPPHSPAAGEFSVHYVDGLHQFVAVYSESWPSSDILARTATTPVGPWSEPVKLYTVPEMYEQPSNVFCYSGKAQPQMSGENYFVLSYVCNSFVMNDVIEDATLYMPKFVRINY